MNERSSVRQSPAESTIKTPPQRGRKHHFFLILMMALLLLVVVFAAFRIIPLGSVDRLSNRQARKMLAEAQHWEDQSLPLSAAEIYEGVSGNSKIDSNLRFEAAKHLVWLKEQLGKRFLKGVVLHTGPRVYELAERIVAAPIATIWA